MAVSIALTLLAAEVVLRFLPVATALPVEPPTVENPIQRYVANHPYTWSFGWNMNNVVRGRSNAQGFLADYDCDPADRLATEGRRSQPPARCLRRPILVRVWGAHGGIMATVLEPKINRASAPESSDRGFGFVFAVVFALIGCWPFLYWQPPRGWALAIAAAFVLVALIRPQILHPLNRLWLALGRLLHKIVSPLVMGLIFFTTVTPTGWIMRLLGKDVLSLRRRPDFETYWIKREPSRPGHESMKNQF